MTHDERVRHPLYETNEGILEHAERIASLEELVLDYYDAPCFGCDPWSAEGWRDCKHCDCGNCDLAVRTLELVGLEGYE